MSSSLSVSFTLTFSSRSLVIFFRLWRVSWLVSATCWLISFYLFICKFLELLVWFCSFLSIISFSFTSYFICTNSILYSSSVSEYLVAYFASWFDFEYQSMRPSSTLNLNSLNCGMCLLRNDSKVCSLFAFMIFLAANNSSDILVNSSPSYVK